VDGAHIGTTTFCLNTVVKSFSSVGIIVVAVHDTLVFLAISSRLLSWSLGDTWIDKIKSFYHGRGMGIMSRALLQTGQSYYLATAGMNIAAMAVILSPSVPPVLRATLVVPNIALSNVMACRVFRHVKLGLIKDIYTLTTETASTAASLSLQFNPDPKDTQYTEATNTTFTSHTYPPSHSLSKGLHPPTEVLITTETRTRVSVIDPLESPSTAAGDWRIPDNV